VHIGSLSSATKHVGIVLKYSCICHALYVMKISICHEMGKF